MSKWRWVPVEPEQEMLDAAYDAQGYQARQGMRAAWAAMLAAAPTPQPEAVAWPKVNGTARMFDNARALMVIMEREPTDDEMRAFDDAIKGWGTSPPAAPQPEAQPVAWREHVEQRIRSWRQRTMNRYGDRLAIDDYMSADAIDDLVDYVCDEYAAPPPSAPCPHIRSSGTGEWATNWCALNGPPAAPEPSEAEVEAGIAAMDDVYSHPAQQRAAITEQDREAMRAALRAAAAARGR